MNNDTDIILLLYRGFISKRMKDGIPVWIRPNAVIGTVQDDPFDCWVEEEIRKMLPPSFEVFHTGKLTSPDIIIRNKSNGQILGLEIKKLIQQKNGKDPRGLTLDYNSCLPCGRAMVKVGGDTIVIPCYYMFVLMSHDNRLMQTMIILDGDFINYDFELHKEAKYSNITEYAHGPYGEGSVRHRKMFTYPNPLNSHIQSLYLRQILILKKSAMMGRKDCPKVMEQIVRRDKYGNDFYYLLIDETCQKPPIAEPITIMGIFDACKQRNPKERVAYIPEIPKLEVKGHV